MWCLCDQVHGPCSAAVVYVLSIWVYFNKANSQSSKTVAGNCNRKPVTGQVSGTIMFDSVCIFMIQLSYKGGGEKMTST